MPALIITLQLDEGSASRLSLLRQRYFPPERNFLAAHLTLFHSLGSAQLARIQALCGEATRALDLQFVAPRPIGRGVVIEVSSGPLVRMHTRLRELLAGGLTAQDQQKLRPHVTIQNKVSAAQAASTLIEVQSAFVPWQGQGLGLTVWRYLGGPWEPHLQLPLPDSA